MTLSKFLAMEPTIFQAHPEIIEDMFYYLDSNTLLNCRLVCKSWNQFLENTTFWLDKLYEIGQPEEVETAWKDLIAKSENKDIEKDIFAKCLRMKFIDFIRNKGKRYTFSWKISPSTKLTFPPLYTASEYGLFEIVKTIYKLGLDCNRKIMYGPRSFVMPIFAAIKIGHNEIVKFFIENSQENPELLCDDNDNNLLMSAISNKNLDLVKFFVPKTPNLNFTNSFSSRKEGAIHLAICDYEILKYLVSLTGVDPNLLNFDDLTALQLLCDDDKTFRLKVPPGDVAKMIRILAPLTNKKHLQETGYKTRNPLKKAIASGSIEALNALLEFFDPNEGGWRNLPIDNAIILENIEAVKILAPLTKDLKEIMSNHSGYITRKRSMALDVVQSFIDERKGISKRKIDVNSCETCKEPASKKIRVEPRVDNLYELPFGNKFKVFTKDQIERMIQQFTLDQNKNS